MMNHSLRIILILLNLPLVFSAYPTSKNGPADATFEKFAYFQQAKLTAFVDVNNDRRTDTIVVNKDNGIQVLLEPDARQTSFMWFDTNANKPPTSSNLLPGSDFNTIRTIIASDFNGDSVADLLVLTSSKPDSDFTPFICTGFRDSITYSYSLAKPKQIGNTTFSSVPMIGDFNADGIADIYGQIDDNTRAIIYGGNNLAMQTAAYSGPKWLVPGYAAFGDFDRSSIGSALIFVENQGKAAIQYFPDAMASFPNLPDVSRSKLVKLPDVFIGNQAVIGQFRFADFNLDGYLDFLLIGCSSSNCVNTGHIFIFEFKTQAWSEVKFNIVPEGVPTDGTWSFTPADSQLELSSSLVSGLTHGDVDSDGLIDLTIVLTLTDSSGTYKVPAILRNLGGLKFQAHLLPGVDLPGQKVVQVAFFDQQEDGVLDIWVTAKDSSNVFNTYLYIQTQQNNNYFLMTMILSGLCDNNPNCMGYGVPIPGSSSSFETSTIEGVIKSAGVTAPLGSYTSLELPYVLFGVGELANYIENVQVTVLAKPSTGLFLSRTAEFVVPSSQLVSNPFMRNNPSDWHLTLFLQPLRHMKVLWIAVTLVAFMIFFGFLVAILQCLEYREDRHDKQQEAQGFHF